MRLGGWGRQWQAACPFQQCLYTGPWTKEGTLQVSRISLLSTMAHRPSLLFLPAKLAFPVNHLCIFYSSSKEVNWRNENVQQILWPVSQETQPPANHFWKHQLYEQQRHCCLTRTLPCGTALLEHFGKWPAILLWTGCIVFLGTCAMACANCMDISTSQCNQPTRRVR